MPTLEGAPIVPIAHGTSGGGPGGGGPAVGEGLGGEGRRWGRAWVGRAGGGGGPRGEGRRWGRAGGGGGPAAATFAGAVWAPEHSALVYGPERLEHLPDVLICLLLP